METAQILLIIVVSSLTILLFIVGIQIILAIIDLRKSIKRLNSLLEDAILGGGLIQPNKITSVVEMFKKDKKMQKRGQG